MAIDLAKYKSIAGLQQAQEYDPYRDIRRAKLSEMSELPYRAIAALPRPPTSSAQEQNLLLLLEDVK